MENKKQIQNEDYVGIDSLDVSYVSAYLELLQLLILWEKQLNEGKKK